MAKPYPIFARTCMKLKLTTTLISSIDFNISRAVFCRHSKLIFSNLVDTKRPVIGRCNVTLQRDPRHVFRKACFRERFWTSWNTFYRTDYVLFLKYVLRNRICSTLGEEHERFYRRGTCISLTSDQPQHEHNMNLRARQPLRIKIHSARVVAADAAGHVVFGVI